MTIDQGWQATCAACGWQSVVYADPVGADRALDTHDRDNLGHHSLICHEYARRPDGRCDTCGFPRADLRHEEPIAPTDEQIDPHLADESTT